MVKLKLRSLKTRMTTFKTMKFKISDEQTNIDKYRLTANITKYHVISQIILQRSLLHVVQLVI